MHRWKQEEAKSAVSRFQIRKKYTYKSVSSVSANRCRNFAAIRTKKQGRLPTDCRKPVQCPFSRCMAMVKRLSRHLIKVHSIPKGSHLLAKYLNKAKHLQRDEDTDDSFHEDRDQADELTASCHIQEQCQLTETVSSGSVGEENPQGGLAENVDSRAGARTPRTPRPGGVSRSSGASSHSWSIFLPSILHYVTYVYNSIQCTLQPIIGLIQDFQVIVLTMTQ